MNLTPGSCTGSCHQLEDNSCKYANFWWTPLVFFRFQGSRRFVFYLTFGDKERDCRRVPLLKNGSSTYLPYLLQVQLPANYTTTEWMQTTSPLSAPDPHSTFRRRTKDHKYIFSYSTASSSQHEDKGQRGNFDFIWSTLHKELSDRRKAIILVPMVEQEWEDKNTSGSLLTPCST